MAPSTKINPSPNLSPFAERLKQERVGEGLTHRDLAERCGVSQNDVRAWEGGEKFPSAFQFKKLRGSLRVMAHFLPPNLKVLKTSATTLAIRDDSGSEAVQIENVKPLDSPPAPPSEPKPKTFGAALALERLREGLTQEELGVLVGVTQTTVSSWELCETFPVLENAKKLLSLLPGLAHAPAPDSRDIPKPPGPQGMTFAKNGDGDAAKVTGVELDLDENLVDMQRAEIRALRAELEHARADSVETAANAMRTLVRAGFLTQDEAEQKWLGRLR